MAPTAPTTRIAPSLEKRLATHKEDVARLREEPGDPAEALDALVRGPMQGTPRMSWAADPRSGRIRRAELAGLRFMEVERGR